MKEVVCNKVLSKKQGTDIGGIKKELKRILPLFYTINSGDFGSFYISKFVPCGGSGDRAKIRHRTKTIEIGDKKLYLLLKQFGEKHEYLKLIKCWKGCEQEVIDAE